MAFEKNTYINNYKREHYKRIQFEVKKDVFENSLAPAASLRGLTVAAYVREAVEEKLEREKELYAGKKKG